MAYPNPAMQTHQTGIFAVKVRSRAEINISGVLREKGYSILLPTYVDQRQYTDRIKKAQRPLFPGYIFVHMDSREFLELVTTAGVSYVVKQGTVFQPLPAEEENILNALCGMVEECEPCEHFQVGQKVWIQSGPLKNQIGILTRMGGKDRIVVQINSIFSAVSIDLKHTEVTLIPT